MHRLRLLSDVAEGLILSFDKPLDSHSITLFVGVLKYLKTGWNTKFCIPSSS